MRGRRRDIPASFFPLGTYLRGGQVNEANPLLWRALAERGMTGRDKQSRGREIIGVVCRAQGRLAGGWR